MIRFIFVLPLFLLINILYGQNALVKQWDKSFGGIESDDLKSFQHTSDGGYILGGSSRSDISGSKTQNSYGNYDYWILKVDAVANKVWDKDFGGANEDILSCVRQTADKGYILGGYSLSGIGGDKTSNNWDVTETTYDCWIVKTDSIGNMQWQKNFGGNNDDFLFDIRQTVDGGYIIGAYSKSNISGDKTQANWDTTNTTFDYWIIKTDVFGFQLWDKDFGGNGHDWLNSLEITSDGGYIFGGPSNSGISGNKSQASKGADDFWVIKTDEMGIIQ
jgi:hypothetical protein